VPAETTPRESAKAVVSPAQLALRFISGKYQGGEFPLRASVAIGRSSECDLVLVEEMVSVNHAAVRLLDGQLEIEDLGSETGTFVNGEKLTAPRRIGEGDRILIGTSILKVVRLEPATVAPEAVRARAVAATQTPGQLILRFVSGRDEGIDCPLCGERLVLGSDDRCDVVLSEDMVSKRHASLRIDGEELTLEDLGSTNGTFVNGEKIREPTRVRHGDRILLGTSIIKIWRAEA
jgi:pSer/pThr/pTyr-binding forkhead associated (FHA) protein